jgi:hypothetical protein
MVKKYRKSRSKVSRKKKSRSKVSRKKRSRSKVSRKRRSRSKHQNKIGGAATYKLHPTFEKSELGISMRENLPARSREKDFKSILNDTYTIRNKILNAYGDLEGYSIKFVKPNNMGDGFEVKTGHITRIL